MIFNSKYYTLDRILKTNAAYNIIIGERSNGKTYAALMYGLKRFFDNGEQMAIIRRWQVDIRGSRASDMFTALIANGEIKRLSGGKYEGVYHYGGKFYVCTYDDNRKALYNENDLFCYSFALSDTEHNKSISYPYITTIVFDEFLTRQVYLQDEFVLFMNTISTIIRQRTNVKIFMLGNTVSKYCPYFKEMGLTNIHKQEQGTIDVYTYGKSELKVAVEYAESIKKYKKNNYYFAFNNPKLSMITGGAWELDIYPHCPIKYTKKDIIFIYFIIFNEKIYQAEIVTKDRAYFTFIHEKTTPIQKPDKDLIYTLENDARMNYNTNILLPRNTLEKRVLWFFQTNKVFYQDNDTGEAISNFIKTCRRL